MAIKSTLYIRETLYSASLISEIHLGEDKFGIRKILYFTYLRKAIKFWAHIEPSVYFSVTGIVT